MRRAKLLTVLFVCLLLLQQALPVLAASQDAAPSAESEDTSSEEVVSLSDLLLELCDEDGDGELSEQEIKNTTELDLSDRSLTSLDGIEQMTALTAIDLSYNDLEDITPLTALQDLTAISLYENHNLNSAEPLAELPRLTQLSITYDKKSGFPTLPALTRLYLDGTGQTAIDHLTPQSSLESLIIINTRASDFSILPICYPNLERLAFYNSTAINASQLIGFSTLTELSLQKTVIRSPEGLGTLTGLVSLELTETGFSNLSLLDSLQRLTVLVIREDNVTDLSPLKNHTALQALTVESNGVETLPKLRTLTGLTPENTHFVLPKVSLQTARVAMPDNLRSDDTWMRENFDTANSPVFYRVSIVFLGAGLILLLIGTILAYGVRRKQKTPEPEEERKNDNAE